MAINTFGADGFGGSKMSSSGMTPDARPIPILGNISASSGAMSSQGQNHFNGRLRRTNVVPGMGTKINSNPAENPTPPTEGGYNNPMPVAPRDWRNPSPTPPPGKGFQGYQPVGKSPMGGDLGDGRFMDRGPNNMGGGPVAPEGWRGAGPMGLPPDKNANPWNQPKDYAGMGGSSYRGPQDGFDPKKDYGPGGWMNSLPPDRRAEEIRRAQGGGLGYEPPPGAPGGPTPKWGSMMPAPPQFNQNGVNLQNGFVPGSPMDPNYGMATQTMVGGNIGYDGSGINPGAGPWGPSVPPPVDRLPGGPFSDRPSDNVGVNDVGMGQRLRNMPQKWNGWFNQ